MHMKRLTYILLLSALSANTSFAEERPKAFMKAQYTAWHSIMDKKTAKPFVTEDKYILQIGNGSSYYYDPQTFYVDSLNNDPVGRVMVDQITRDALHEFATTGADSFAIMREKGIMRGNGYRNQKDFVGKNITAWDIDGGDRYQYEVNMTDLEWEVCDSTENILGYDCNLATADYHGRRWKAWFAPDIAVQDGPWQLCGLPGLIRKAESEDGEYGFIMTGVQECDEQFKPILINPDRLFKTKRKSYLKMRDYARRNRSARISAMTGGKVNVKADYTGTADYIETDYHE